MDDADSALLDPAGFTTRDDLARALTALREHRGLTVRDLARSAGLPLATVSGYLTGRHVPPLAAADQFRGMLTALGVADGDVPAWTAAVNRLRRAPGRRPVTARPPYRGLAAYQPEDAALFFGREDLTESLTARVLGSPTTPVVVIGSSGSGKSSLLRAGLAARLRSNGTPVVIVEPGDDPAGSVAAAVGDGLAAGTVLVLDQAEALFGTDVPPAVAVDLFERLEALHRSGVVVVVGLRGDFFDKVLGVETAARWLVENQFLVGPLSADALRRVIAEPARAAGIEVEPALVEVLVSEATGGPGASLEPGALPLLSHALYVTWLAATGHRLTLAGYREAGGLAGAIAKSGEEVHGSLTPEQQAVERSTLLRLVQVRDGFADMRRTARASSFATPPESEVVAAYVEARLVTSDREQVQLAHEALLTALPRLHAWLEEDRDGLRLHNRLAESAHYWADADRDPDLLYRGSTLEAVQRWADGSGRSMSDVERDFVERSAAAEAQRAAARRRAGRRLRALTAVLGVLALSTGGLATVSVVQNRRAVRERDLAVSRQLAVTAQSLAGTDPALGSQVAVAANLEANTVEGRSALLSAAGRTPVARLASTGAVINAVAVSPDGTYAAVAGESGKLLLWSTGTRPHQLAALDTPGSRYDEAFTADGAELAAVGAKAAIDVWRVTDPAHPVKLRVDDAGTSATFYGVTVSADGSTMASGASDGTVQLWRRGPDGGYAHAGSIAAFKGTVQAVALDATGTTLAAGGSDGMLALWDVREPARPVELGAPVTSATGKITSLALSPDGRTLAAGATDDLVHLWDVTSPAAPVAGTKLAGPLSWVNSVRFNADGTRLAAASSDKHLWVWDTTSGAVSASLPHPTTLITADWGHDGKTLYSGGADGLLREWSYPGDVLGGFASAPGQGVFNGKLMATSTKDGVRLWDVTDPVHPVLTGIGAPPSKATLDGAVDVSAALKLLVAGDTAGGVSFWDIADPSRPRYLTTVPAHTDWVDSVSFDRSGTRLVTGSDDASITFWDLSHGIPHAPTARMGDLGGFVYSASFSPDSTTVVASVLSGQVLLIDVRDLARPTRIGDPLTGPKGYVYSAAFSPDGRTIAASGNDKSVWLWDVTDPSRPRPLAGPLVWADGYATNIGFSPDGRYLAAGMTDGTVRLWDVSDRNAPRRWVSLDGVSGNVFGVEFSPDGRYVSGAGADRTLRIWPLSLPQARRTVCASATRGLPMSTAEWGQIVDGVTEPATCP